MSTSLSVTVKRVCYPPATEADATWFILDTNQGTCKGTMSWRPLDGQALALDGMWGDYRGNREFKFTSAMINVPDSPRGKLSYVVARTSGIGPAMEQLIWDHAGDQWEMIAPGDVKGLKGAKYEKFQRSIELLHEDIEMVRAIVYLTDKGATPKMAAAAWEEWEKEAPGIVADNPFRLAELPNYGFKDVDGRIRIAYGISDDDPRRVSSAVVYSLRQLTSSGSTVVQWKELMQSCSGLLGGKQKLIVECTSGLFADGSLKAFESKKLIALMADYTNGQIVWEYANMNADQRKEVSACDLNNSASTVSNKAEGCPPIADRDHRNMLISQLDHVAAVSFGGQSEVTGGGA